MEAVGLGPDIAGMPKDSTSVVRKLWGRAGSNQALGKPNTPQC